MLKIGQSNLLKIFSYLFIMLIMIVNTSYSIESDFIDYADLNQSNKSLSNHTVQYIEDRQGISVLNYTGNYDKGINGVFNKEARQAVLQEFYLNQNDEYDFVYIFSEFEFETGIASAFAFPVMNDVQGIGKDIFNISEDFFSDNLKNIIDMGALSRRDFNLENIGYDNLLGIMMHETMHYWGISVKYLDSNSQVSDRLLGSADAHWSYFLNSNASIMYGSLWQETIMGQFKTIDTNHGLSPLDLYLAGFSNKNSVPDFFIINNASSGLKTDFPPSIGTEVTGEKELVSINDIIAFEGDRVPNNENSQHQFKVKFILLKSPNDEINSQSIANLYILQNQFQRRFFAETGGVGQIDFPKELNNSGSLDPEILYYDPLLNTSFEIQSAVGFLLSEETNDWWQDRNSTKVRDTVASIKALQLIIDDFPEAQNKLNAAILWLNNYQPQNNDDIAWMLSSGVLINEVKQNLIGITNHNKKSNGGWGITTDAKASPYDTALTINGLLEAQGDDFNLDTPSTQFVLDNINLDSGFSFVSGGQSNVFTTSLLLQSIDKVSSNTQHLTDLAGYIVNQALPDNSYGGNGIGTPHETAQVIKALESLQDNNYQSHINLTKSALDGMQSVDGSMQGSIYSTALAINVFNTNDKANLYFSQVELSNNNVIAGEQISVNFEIKNSGVVNANNIEVTVYKDIVDVNNEISQVTIDLLAPNQVVTTALFLDTTEFSFNSELILVIDKNNSINENNENDNSFTTSIVVQQPNSEPELAFNAGLFTINPSVFDVLPFTISTSATVANLSLENIDNVIVTLSKIESNGEFTLLGSQSLSISSLTTQEITYNVEITQASTDIQLILNIDPNNDIIERNENNNSHNLTVKKIQSIDVAIASQDIIVNNQIVVGDVQNISFDVHNAGTSLTSSFSAHVYSEKDNDVQLIHQSQIAESLAGETINRNFTWQPLNEGIYNLRFVLDENNELAENNEDNNEIIIVVEVLANALSNIRISETDLVITPDPGLSGQDLDFSLSIHNDSIIDTPNFDIKVYKQNSGGTPNTLLTTIENVASVQAGSTSNLQWTINNTILSGEVAFIIEVDANDEVLEFNENDNLIITNIRILTMPDAYVSSGGIQLNPTIPVLGEPLSVLINISNLGEQDLSQLSVSLYYDDSQANNPVLVSTQDITLLAGGQSQQTTFGFTFPNDSNIDSFIVIVDEFNTVNESNENNNQANILVNNQDQSLYVSSRYFSPNGDGVKDHTIITFNTEVTDDYQLQIFDSHLKLIRQLDSVTFLNTTFGDVIWDGKTDKGIIARDGTYTIDLLNQNSEVIDSTVVTLDTNRSSIYQSLVENNQHFTDLNCIGSQFATFQFAKDGRSLYTKSYVDNSSNTKSGLFEIEDDGSKIKSLIPSSFFLTSNLHYFVVLENGNIFVVLKEQDNTYTLYIKNIINGSFNQVSTSLDNYVNVVANENDFVLIITGNELHKIYFDGITPKQIKIGFQQFSEVTNLHSGILVPINGDRYFVSYDFSKNNTLIFNNIENPHLEVSKDERFFVYEDTNKVYFYKNSNFEVNLLYELDVNNLTYEYGELGVKKSSGITIHNELFIINDDATISIYNNIIEPILTTQSTSLLQDFDSLLAFSSPSFYFNDQDVTLYVDDITDSYFTQKIISHKESSDKKEMVIILENTLFATFDVRPCDNNVYVCDIGEGPWPTSVSNVRVDSNMIYVKLNYDNIDEVTFETIDSINTIPDFDATQESRSDFILYNNNAISEFVNTNDLEMNLGDYNYAYLLKMVASYPQTKITEIINKFALEYNGNEGVEGLDCPIVNSSPQYIYRSKANLYADLKLINNQQTIEITATAFDKNFEKYEILWESPNNPNQWNLLFTSTDTIDNEIVFNWQPLESSLYKIKILGYDKAGNQYDDIETISINNANSSIRNINVSPLYFSPNGDGIKDIVTIDYEITTAVDLLVEIKNVSGLTVRTYEREYLNALAMDSIIWDGKDQLGNLLTDGKYIISIQGINSEVYLDTTGITLDKDLDLRLTGPSQILSNKLFANYINTIKLNNLETEDLLILKDDYSTHVFQFFNQATSNWQDFNNDLLVKFDANNITDILNANYRLKIEDKAGNISFIDTVKPSQKYIQIQLKKIINSNEKLTNKFMFNDEYITSSYYNPRPLLDIVDWDNGDKIAYVIQPIDLEEFNSVKLILTYTDNSGELIESSQFVNSANFSIVSEYFGNNYVGINVENNNIHDVVIDSSPNGCLYPPEDLPDELIDEDSSCDLTDDDSQINSSDVLPIILIELDQNDFPDTENPITVQFAFDGIYSTASKITFNPSTNNVAGVEIITKELKFDSEFDDLDGMPSNALVAYNSIITSIPYDTNFEYVWVYQDSNLQMETESLFVENILGDGSILSIESFNPDFIDSTDDYISKLYILIPNACKINKKIIFRAVNFFGDVIESFAGISNDFCIETELNPSFYLGEFCSNAFLNNPRIKLDMVIDVTDQQSSLPILLELYRLDDINNELIFSDTNLELLPSNNNQLRYHHSVEFNSAILPTGNQRFKLVVTDASGNTENKNAIIFIDPLIASNQMTSPQANTLYCADGEQGRINIDINANISNRSQYGVRPHLIINGVNSEVGLAYSAFNHFDLINQSSSEYNDTGFFSTPKYSGSATLLLETFNSSGTSYCHSVNVNVDSLVEFSLVDEVATGVAGEISNIFSPNADGVKDSFRFASIQAIEDITIDINLYQENDPANAMGSIISTSLNSTENQDLIWSGVLNGNVVVDGKYIAVLSITDNCGLTRVIEIPVTVDTTAPVSTFINPVDAAGLNAIHRVVIDVLDDNLTDGTNDFKDNIEVEYFYNNVWNTIEILSIVNPTLGNYQIQLDWNLTNLPAAIYPLRITVEDVVGNVSSNIINPELLNSQDIFWDFNLSALYISPNADSIQDNASIIFGINLDSVISIDILDSNQNNMRSLTNNQMYNSGSHQIVFNGMDSNGIALIDGIYIIRITGSEAANLTNTSILELSLAIDTQAPQIQWQLPLASITKAEGIAQVQLDEQNPLTFVVTNQRLNPLSQTSELVNTGQSGIFDLLNLESLEETQYQLQATASDLAGNTDSIILDYLVDKTLPVIELISPANDTFIGGLDGLVTISGSINDSNFDYYDLSIAEASETPDWQVIFTDTALTELQFDYQWLSSVNDGAYLLKLSVYDQAGWLVETTVNIILDKTAPLSLISQPIDNATVGSGTDLMGSANDENFDLYTLSYKSTAASTWTLFNLSQVPIVSTTLGQLPENLMSGTYEVMLSVQDKIGLTSNHIINITLDVSPPPTPENFTAENININQVTMAWNLVTSSDMAGYIIYRNGQPLNPQDPIVNLSQNQYLDGDLSDGEYIYQIASIDLLGNLSELSIAASITIDSIAPDVSIFSPADGQNVNNIIEVRGSATSLLDFNSFALYIRQIAQPAPGMLINQSPIAVTNGLLGVINTTLLNQNTDYVIRLEAIDNSGNTAFVENTIFVDNIAPNSPQNLTYQLQNSNDVILQWDANSDTDLAGYLVFLNGVVITGSGSGEINISNAITQTTFNVTNLNDGTHDFNLVAIDDTGNISSPSNSVQVIINLRAPDTIIISPITAQKFDTPILFEASSDDTDIAEIRFEYSVDSSNWVILDTDFSAPYQSTLNPVDLALVYGNIYLRATATDASAQFDATPAQVSIEYTDLTPPQVVTGLITNIQGGLITLNWDNNTETDFAGYIINRIVDGQSTPLTALPIQANSYVDTGLDDGDYIYQIIAVDNVDNHSLAIETENLQVFSVLLQQPYSPLLTPSQTQLIGQSELGGGNVQITLQNTNGTNSFPDLPILGINNHTFNLPAIDLASDLNSLEVVHVVSATHRSKISSVQVEVSPVPSMPLNFSAVVNNLSSELSWQAPDINTFGYLPYRDGLPINISTQITSGISYQASSRAPFSLNVSDNNLQSSWSPSQVDVQDDNPTFIELDFDQSYWVSEIELNWVSFNGQLREPSAYELQYFSAVGWVTISELDGSGQSIVNIITPQPYLTNKVKLVFKNPIGVYELFQLAEFKVIHQPLITQTSTSITEVDGTYNYQVSAINKFGYESLLTDSIELSIGDVSPPETVILSAQISGVNDVMLNWEASVSSDVGSYWLFRNDELILITSDAITLNHIDSALPNGTYNYYIRAVDAVGNASDNSNTVSIDIQQQALPIVQNVSIYAPLTGSSLILDWNHEVSPRLDHYNVYRSLQSSGPYTKIVEVADNHYQDDGLTNGTTYFYTLTVADEFNNESVYSNEVSATPNDVVPAATPVISLPTVFGAPINLSTPLTTISGSSDPGALIDLYINNVYQTTILSLLDSSSTVQEIFEDYNQTRLSKNGDWYAYNYYEDLYIKNLITNTGVSEYFDMVDYTWNNAGSLLYILLYDDNSGGIQIASYDTNLNEVQIFMTENSIQSAIPSPDESMIFYQGDYTDSQSGQTNSGLWIYNIANSSAIAVPIQGEVETSNSAIVWSADNQNVAFINQSNGGSLYYYHIDSNTLTLIDTVFGQQNSMSWSPNNSTILYDKFNPDQELFTYDLSTTQISQLFQSANTIKFGHYSSDGNKIVYTQDCCEVFVYDILNQTTESIYSSNANIDGLVWNNDHEIEIITDGKFITVSSPGGFRFDNVSLENGINNIHVVARDNSGNESPASLPIVIDVQVTGLADIVVNSNDFIVSPTSGLQGTTFVASVEVSNQGDLAVIDANVSVQLTLPDGSSEIIIPTQNKISLLAGGSQSIFMDLGERTLTGNYFIQLSLDPENSIEEINENNNNANLSFNVLESFDPVVQVLLTPQIAAPNQTVNVDIDIYNPSELFNGSVQLIIADINDFPVGAPQQFSIINLGTDEDVQFTYDWDTHDVFAGIYQVTVQLTAENGEILDHQTYQISLISYAEFELSLEVQDSTITEGENLAFTTSIHYLSGNTPQNGTLQWEIQNSNQQIVWTDSVTLPLMFSDFNTVLNNQWSAQDVGDYQLIMRFDANNDQQILISPFSVEAADAVISLQGEIDNNPTSIILGDNFTINYNLLNSGDIDLNNIPINIKILNADLSSTIADNSSLLTLAINQSTSLSSEFSSSALTTNNYLIAMYADLSAIGGNSSQLIDTRSINALDVISPEIVIITPQNNSLQLANIDLRFSITDRDSLITSITIQSSDINQGNILPININQLNEIYNLQLFNLAQGQHQFIVTAIDAPGNIAQQTISYTVDRIAPIIELTGVADDFYYNESVTSNVNIIDENLIASEILLNGNSIPAIHEIIEEGEYFLNIRAEDFTNNISTQSISFTLDFTAPIITTTFPETNSEIGQLTTEVTGYASENSLVVLSNGSYQEQVQTFDNGFFRFVNVPLELGVNTIELQATDLSGNTSTIETLNITAINQEPVSALLDSTIEYIAEEDLPIGYSLINNTNNDYNAMDVKIELYDLSSNQLIETQLETVNLLGSQTLQSTLQFISPNLNIGRYQVILSIFIDGQWQYKSEKLIRLIFRGFGLNVNLPLANGIYNTDIVTSVDVTDTFNSPPDVQYKLDDTNIWSSMVNTAGTNYVANLSLTNGSHEIQYRVNSNNVINPFSSKVNFEIDTVAPIINVTSPTNGLITNQNVLLDFNATDDNLLEVTALLNGLDVSIAQTITEDGVYTLSITAIDIADNQTTKDVQFIIDTINPTIELTNVIDTQQFVVNDIEIIGTTEPFATLELDYSTNHYETTANEFGEFVLTDVNLDEGENNLVFIATDRASNQSTPIAITLHFESVNACTVFGFKNATPYNGFVFHDFIAQNSAVQGRLAVGNQVSLSRYTIGQELTLATAGDVLIAGGDINFAHDQLYFGNILSAEQTNIGQTVIDNMHPDATITANAQLPVDFIESYTQLKLFSNALFELTENSTYAIVDEVLQLQGDCLAELQVYNIDGNELETINSIGYNCLAENSYLILNVTGLDVQFNRVDLSQLSSISQRIIWNFHQAQTVVIHNITIHGSILAVDAMITGDEPLFMDSFEELVTVKSKAIGLSGFINGQVIARDYINQHQLNHQPLNCSSNIQVNAAPIAVDKTITTEINTAINFSLGVIDENQSNLQYQQLSQVAFGQINGTLPNLTFIPDIDFEGDVFFDYQVTDQLGKTSNARINIEVLQPLNKSINIDLKKQNIQKLINDLPLINTLKNIILGRRK
jgi:choice-of-anchor A domain-containing protein